jgi:hypothetical protein
MQREHRCLRLEGHPVQSVMAVTVSASNGGSPSTSAPPPPTTSGGRHRDVTLCAGTHGNAALVDADGRGTFRHSSDGLAATLSRLRSRRSSTGTLASRRGASAPTMMTMTERMCQAGEIEPVVYGPRSVGALGTAEHRGRLMTFQ